MLPPDMSVPVDMSLPRDLSVATDMSPLDLGGADLGPPADLGTTVVCPCVCGPKQACIYTRNGCR
jgi:hypothetical protein